MYCPLVDIYGTPVSFVNVQTTFAINLYAYTLHNMLDLSSFINFYSMAYLKNSSVIFIFMKVY